MSESPSPEKISLQTMIDACLEYAMSLEVMVENAKGNPQWDLSYAKQKAQVFRNTASTLDLVKLHEKQVVEIFRGRRR